MTDEDRKHRSRRRIRISPETDLRVLAFAYKETGDEDRDCTLEDEDDLTFLGLDRYDGSAERRIQRLR